jgi:hypothetical protein
MPFTQFKQEDFQSFGYKYKTQLLFDKKDVKTVRPSKWLIETINRANSTGFNNEKSRSERLVSPILIELHERNKGAFTLHSGVMLNVDETRGLNGECDFVLSHEQNTDYLHAPIFCITEAKKQDIEGGIIQCSFQLIAAQTYNKQEGYQFDTIYGCVSSGAEWRFIKITDNQVIADIKHYTIDDLPMLLGVLQKIVDDKK